MAQAPMPPPAPKKSFWGEFKDFLTTGDLIMVAVGLVLALYTKAIVDAILNGILYPIIAAIFGKPDITFIGFDIGDSRISIGLVLTAIINFVVVGFLLFLIVKMWRKLIPEKTGPSELDVLTEIRDELRAGRSPQR